MGARNEETRDRSSIYMELDDFENNDRDDSEAGSRIFNFHLIKKATPYCLYNQPGNG